MRNLFFKHHKLVFRHNKIPLHGRRTRHHLNGGHLRQHGGRLMHEFPKLLGKGVSSPFQKKTAGRPKYIML